MKTLLSSATKTLSVDKVEPGGGKGKGKGKPIPMLKLEQTVKQSRRQKKRNKTRKQQQIDAILNSNSLCSEESFAHLPKSTKHSLGIIKACILQKDSPDEAQIFYKSLPRNKQRNKAVGLALVEKYGELIDYLPKTLLKQPKIWKAAMTQNPLVYGLLPKNIQKNIVKNHHDLLIKLHSKDIQLLPTSIRILDQNIVEAIENA